MISTGIWSQLTLHATRAGGAALLALLGACGGGGGGDPTPTPTVSAVTVGAPRYSQSVLITVDGSSLDLLPTVSSAGCSSIVRSTVAPNVSTSTRAFYNCTVGSTGVKTVTVSYNGATLGSQTYTVPEPQVTMTLSGGVAGDIVLTLDPTRAPRTVDNFLRYVADGFYNGTTFHRVIAGFVAQGGGYVVPAAAGAVPAAKGPLRAPIALEVGTGLSNTALTIAMARTNVVDSATSQFFINLVNNSGTLDPSASTPGYAVFGSVTGGAGVVSAVAAAPCAAVASFSECAPNPSIVIATAFQSR